MSDINWDLAPEGATEIVTDGDPKALRWAKKDSVWSFVNEEWKFRNSGWQTIATRPQPNFKATRENLEKIAKDAKGDFVEVSEPQWTHKYGDDNCYVKVPEPDQDGYIVLCTEVDGYMLAKPVELEPIKPTISTSEKEKCAAMAVYFNINPAEFDEYMSKYEVVE